MQYFSIAFSCPCMLCCIHLISAAASVIFLTQACFKDGFRVCVAMTASSAGRCFVCMFVCMELIDRHSYSFTATVPAVLLNNKLWSVIIIVHRKLQLFSQNSVVIISLTNIVIYTFYMECNRKPSVSVFFFHCYAMT